MIFKEAVRYDVLRWVAMPFAAVIGASLGAGVLVLMVFTAPAGFLLRGSYIVYIISIISAYVFGFLYAYIVYAISPRSKEVAVVVMTTVLCVMGTMMLILGWVLASDNTSLAIRATLQIIAAMVAAVLVAKSCKK